MSEQITSDMVNWYKTGKWIIPANIVRDSVTNYTGSNNTNSYMQEFHRATATTQSKCTEVQSISAAVFFATGKLSNTTPNITDYSFTAASASVQATRFPVHDLWWRGQSRSGFLHAATKRYHNFTALFQPYLKTLQLRTALTETFP